jgi:Nif-specific regulatory protein
MMRRLLALEGPSRWTSHDLEDGEVSIGRSETNRIVVPDAVLSRRHCILRVNQDELTLVDCGSRNGTRLNGQPVAEARLRNGDLIQAGGTVFRVVIGDESSSPGQPSSGTVVLPSENSVYLKPAEMAGEDRPTRDLAVLLRVSNQLAAARTTAEVYVKLESLLAELYPGAKVRVIAREDTAHSDEEADSAAAQGAGLVHDGALLVAPLRQQGEVAAVLRIESGTVRFNNDELDLIAALSTIASLALDNAWHVEYLAGENQRLTEELTGKFAILGKSDAIAEVCRLIGRAAPSDATVLVLGESGTGKELVARALHANSRRSTRPFVAVNCAALNENLLESELFGHEKGSFTGAISQKRGKLEVAEGGTLFLDEVGEMAPALQAKLLRVLQEREFERVGGTRVLRADVRLVAATNRDLEAECRKGAFRQDLYFRLKVISIHTPPLRDRREDIEILASQFTAKFAARAGRRITGISPAAKAALLRYDWPGNVRELENAIEHAVVLGTTEMILVEDLPDNVIDIASDPGQPGSGYHEKVADAKRKILLSAIEEADGNHAAAARSLGLNPTYLSRLLRNLEVR